NAGEYFNRQDTRACASHGLHERLAHSDVNSNSYSYANGNGDANSYPNGYGYADSNRYANADPNPHSDLQSSFRYNQPDQPDGDLRGGERQLHRSRQRHSGADPAAAGEYERRGHLQRSRRRHQHQLEHSPPDRGD